MRRSKLIKTIVLVAVILYILWKLWSGMISNLFSSTGNDLVPQRPWIERLPKDERDRIGAFVVGRFEGQDLGLISHSSVFSRHMELMTWKMDGEQLLLEIMQDGKKLK